jgi:hypothetical protein
MSYNALSCIALSCNAMSRIALSYIALSRPPRPARLGSRRWPPRRRLHLVMGGGGAVRFADLPPPSP